MKKMRFLLVALGLLMSRETFGGFVVTSSGPTSTTVRGVAAERYDIFALNTGNGTGTKLVGAEFFLNAYDGARALLDLQDTDNAAQSGVGPDGIVDTVTLSGTGLNGTQIRVNNAPAFNLYVGISPTNLLQFRQPNPFRNGVERIGGAVASNNPAGATAANVGNGVRFARLYVTPGASFTFHGLLGGDAGVAIPYGLSFNSPPSFINIAPVPDVTVSPGADPNGTTPFVASITATISEGLEGGSVAFRRIPVVGVDIISITGTFSGNTYTYTVQGTVSNSFAGTSVTVPFQFYNDLAYAQGSYRINVLPEPTILVLGAASFLISRRKRT